MAQDEFPLVQDEEPSWANIAVTIDVLDGETVETADFAGIKWDRGVEVGEKRGASGGRVMARTGGQGSQNASATMYRGGLRRLRRALKNAAKAKGFVRGNQVIIGRVAFDVLIQHSFFGSDDIHETRLRGCRYLGDADDMAEGPDADQVEITLNPIEIITLDEGDEVVLV